VGFVAIALLLLSARSWFAFRDRTPGYSVDLNIRAQPQSEGSHPLRAGFARVKITPDISDPKRPIWLAGFHQNRETTGVHDDLWAVACVIDDGATRVGIVALDAIGFFNDDVIRVRHALSQDTKIDYAIVCSTHNHSTPDLLGLWGPSYLKTGVDPEYKTQVIAAAAAALTFAAENLEPARMGAHEIKLPPDGLVSDTRKPEVFDSDLRVLHFVSEAGRTIGTISTWGNHPETVWAGNTELTSDYCGYLRDALEQGISDGKTRAADGVGGIHLFAVGAVGGLMSTTPGTVVTDPLSGEVHREPSHEKARALGRQLALRILPVLTNASPAEYVESAPIQVQARTIPVHLDNKGYVLAGLLGLIDRGHVSWLTLRTEVALLTVGPASLACVPGEIYPEIVNGGIEQAPGADFGIPPLEVPALREMMPGRVKFVLGLANDEIGYLIPKSQWDHAAPYLYDADEAPYGEINSVGPNAAYEIHAALKMLCGRFPKPQLHSRAEPRY
jgi:hypothetical protein